MSLQSYVFAILCLCNLLSLQINMLCQIKIITKKKFYLKKVFFVLRKKSLALDKKKCLFRQTLFFSFNVLDLA